MTIDQDEAAKIIHDAAGVTVRGATGEGLLPPRSDSAGVSQAMARVDRSTVDDKAAGAVARALADKSPPVFNTHSRGAETLFAAQEISLKAIVADLDAKIASLQAERTDAMLAYSMLTAGRLAKEKGASG